MNKKSLFVVLMTITIVFMCNSLRPQKINPQKESISMIQPCGWFWCTSHDKQYAEHVNLPNSEANRNNGDANLSNAQATKVVNESLGTGRSNDFKFGVWAGSVGMIFLLIMGGGFLLLVFGSKLGLDE